jgi:hypothetical protein
MRTSDAPLTIHPTGHRGISAPQWLYAVCVLASSWTSTLLDVGLGLEVVASNEVGDVIVILIVVLLGTVLALLLLHALVALGKFAQRCERVGTKLVKDAGDELCQLLVLAGAVDGEGVGGYRGVDCISSAVARGALMPLPMVMVMVMAVVMAVVRVVVMEREMEMEGPTLWCREVDDVAVALEHVDLLNSLDGLDVELLERTLELLVVGASVPLDLLDLPAGSTLASVLPN